MPAARLTRVAVIGTGVIGSSWAARFLAHGRQVTAWDPAPDGEKRLRTALLAHWNWLLRQGQVTSIEPPELRFTPMIEQALEGAEYVQESGPESLECKIGLYEHLDALTSANTILASSSSGLTASAIQRRCRSPERVLVGHPLNPPHVLPLIEVVAGELTDAATVRRATEFYEQVAMRPIRLRREIAGHIVNRLQAVLWQEMFSLVVHGVATAKEIDEAMMYAIAPRWTAGGPFLSLHLSGGAGGLRTVLEQLGHAMEGWWRDSGEISLTREAIDRLVASTNSRLPEMTWQALAAKRDDALWNILNSNENHIPE